MNPKRFPLFFPLEGKRILVVGGGAIASRRVESLLSFGPEITVWSPVLSSYLERQVREQRIFWKQGCYRPGEMGEDGRSGGASAEGAYGITSPKGGRYFLALSAVSREVDAAVCREARNLGILCNAASDRSLCDFYFPALVETEQLVLGLAGDGANHKMVKEAAALLRRQMKPIRIGSRESRLAVIQSELVADYLRLHTGRTVELVTMKTTGDRILDRKLEEIGGKGLFVKELDRALRDGRSDLSVHSLKDLPMEVPEDLPVLGYSRREDPRDVLVLPEGCSQWDKSKPVGCSSRRRMLQFSQLEPEVTFAMVRGNVLTRLRKLDEGQYGALILAAAGLKRLGLEQRISRYLSTEEMIPAAGQGILAVQGRAGEDYSYLGGYFDPEAAWAAQAERAFVRTLDGGCSSPIAAFAQVQEGTLRLRGLHYNETTGAHAVEEIAGAPEEAEALGVRLADTLRKRLEAAE